MKNYLKKLKNEKGQSLVEFALILILLLLLLLGIVEFARVWFRADLLKGAANIAARTYAVTSGDATAKTTAGQAAAEGVETGMGIKTTFTCADASGTIIACNSDPAPASVTATVSEPFQTVVPGILPMLGIITITRDATYRLEQ